MVQEDLLEVPEIYLKNCINLRVGKGILIGFGKRYEEVIIL